MNRLVFVFRIIAMAICAVSLLFSSVEALYRAAGGPVGSLLELVLRSAGASDGMVIAGNTMAVSVFALLFWATTSPRYLFRPSVAAIAMLSAQVVIVSCCSIELLLLVGVEVAFVLPLRPAMAWVLVQAMVLVGAVGLQVAWSGTHPLMTLFQGQRGSSWIPMALLAVTSQVWHFLSLGLGFLAAGAERQSQELRRINAELRATQQVQAETARLAERLSISRELHDSSGHHLAALSVTLRLMRRTDDMTLVRAKTDECLHIVQQLLSDVRDVVRDLRDGQDVDLPGALAVLAEGLPGLKVHLQVEPGIAIRRPFHAHALFRCCQEILTNTVRHSRASNIWVEISRVPHGIRLSARDDGDGVSQISLGHGLRGMEERTAELGGEFSVRSRRGEGFEVSILLPVRENAA